MNSASFDRLSLDPVAIGSKATYKLMVGAIVPRPIAFVSTINSEGIGNLAPFSFFNGVSSHPPALMIAITRNSDGTKKDTLRNIESTREFVVNSVGEPIIDAVNQCSANYPFGVDEMVRVGLTPLPSHLVRPSRVAESLIHFECRLYQQLEIGDGTEGSSTLIIGQIVMIHVASKAYQDGKILFEPLQAISRLGGLNYGKTSEAFSLPRPKLT
jgi:flavin reductase (DIM6/NTAB) family NADH-FMN oxidoreductase RutF